MRGFEEKVREAVTQIPSIQIASVLQGTTTMPIQHDTKNARTKGEEDAEPTTEIIAAVDEDSNSVEEDNVLETVEDEDLKTGYTLEMKDIWLSATGGVVIGGLVTALGTWLLSR